MTIEFYFMAPSPPSRNAYMVLKALGLNFETKIVNLMKNEQRSPEYLAMNPRGKIPTLKDGDYVIAESRAIAMYLCNQYEKGPDSTRLYPVEPKARGIVDQLLLVSESTSDWIQSYVNLPGVIYKGENTKHENIEEVHKALQLCEKYLEKHDYMAGNHLTLADIFMLSPLLILDFTNFKDYTNYPKTTAWMKTMKDLPYFEESHKEGSGMLEKFYREALAKLNTSS